MLYCLGLRHKVFHDCQRTPNWIVLTIFKCTSLRNTKIKNNITKIIRSTTLIKTEI